MYICKTNDLQVMQTWTIWVNYRNCTYMHSQYLQTSVKTKLLLMLGWRKNATMASLAKEKILQFFFLLHFWISHGFPKCCCKSSCTWINVNFFLDQEPNQWFKLQCFLWSLELLWQQGKRSRQSTAKIRYMYIIWKTIL